MWSLLGLFLVPILAFLGEPYTHDEYENESHIDLLWRGYKQKFSKNYSPREEVLRKRYFLRAYRAIHKQNDYGMEKGLRLDFNQFSDFNEEEMSKRLGYKMSRVQLVQIKKEGNVWAEPMNVKVPDAIDWRDKGYVTDVKNQGQCGSCYAFSATGALEGQVKRMTGKLFELSEQNIVDCSSNYGNDGCDGGLMSYAYKYIAANGGIDTEDSYPYEAAKETCSFNNDTIGADDSGYTVIKSGDEEALKLAVATMGPIAVAIEVTKSFFHYSEGVYYDKKCSHELNHGVLVVGYGTEEDGGDYWIVKNSWGKEWGNEGYIWMARNRENNCGIADMPIFPNYKAV
ncbi:unnamed protein product, partial [Mesorhabditis belari]|uniref:Cathepsin L-like n=1 Tax=Mesorhabditis belari TaxID=2138241 RepID=A0AAF3J3K2_9BILA